jgi:glucose/arabinose dehydrogenase
LRYGAIAALLAVAGCGDGGDRGDGGDGGDRRADDEPSGLPVERTIELEPGTEPAALAALGDRGFLVGERRTGRVRLVTGTGDLDPEPVARVAVISGEDDQRGLLGLAVDGDRVYASWTRAGDGRLVVGEVTGGGERILWAGPPSSELANGGHLAVVPDGRLVVGIGDLENPALVDDSDAPNGKLLTLDPAGPPSQRPRLLSGGWNNPFAFVVAADGAIWVADNAPGDEPERIGRGEGQARGAEPAPLPGRRAPAALVELAPGRLGLCGYLDGELTVVDVRDGRPRLGDRLATGCRTGAAMLADGRLAISDGERVRLLSRP